MPHPDANPSVLRRAGPRAVALETTLLLHGIPRAESLAFARELNAIVDAEGATPALVGILRGRAIAGISEAELREMLMLPAVPKINTSNLGLALHAQRTGATTVSATMELASRAGIAHFATGGLGGVHFGYAERLDVSADLAAFTRFPVAVVTSGVKSILDVVSTREALETLGVTVVGFQTDRFPAFYRRESDARVDERFDDAKTLADFLRFELARTARGIVVANPIPRDAELPEADWSRWLAEAQRRAANAPGRDATPAILGALHELSNGATLRANLALVRSNARLAAQIAAAN
jgi:pseudouridylate synthase